MAVYIAAGFMPISSTWFSGNGQVCVWRGREGGREREGGGDVCVICVFCLIIVCLQVSDHPAALVLANNGFSRLVRMLIIIISIIVHYNDY